MQEGSLWRIKPLVICHLLIAFLLITFFSPLTRPLWESVDLLFFRWINGSLLGHPTWQLFWACANHKWADWVEDVCILLFFTAYVKKAPKGERARAVIQLLFCTLLIAAILFFVNRCLLRSYLVIYRDSPTLAVDTYVSLSQELPWLHVKEASYKSFPGDHGTTAVLFAASYAYLARGRLAIAASIYGAFLCLPRMMAGAHWLSDVIVGSGSIALFFLSWALNTPIQKRFTDGVLFLWRSLRRKTANPVDSH